MCDVNLYAAINDLAREQEKTKRTLTAVIRHLQGTGKLSDLLKQAEQGDGDHHEENETEVEIISGF